MSKAELRLWILSQLILTNKIKIADILLLHYINCLLVNFHFLLLQICMVKFVMRWILTSFPPPTFLQWLFPLSPLVLSLNVFWKYSHAEIALPIMHCTSPIQEKMRIIFNKLPIMYTSVFPIQDCFKNNVRIILLKIANNEMFFTFFLLPLSPWGDLAQTLQPGAKEGKEEWSPFCVLNQNTTPLPTPDPTKKEEWSPHLLFVPSTRIQVVLSINYFNPQIRRSDHLNPHPSYQPHLAIPSSRTQPPT